MVEETTNVKFNEFSQIEKRLSYLEHHFLYLHIGKSNKRKADEESFVSTTRGSNIVKASNRVDTSNKVLYGPSRSG